MRDLPQVEEALMVDRRRYPLTEIFRSCTLQENFDRYVLIQWRIKYRSITEGRAVTSDTLMIRMSKIRCLADSDRRLRIRS
jgi:hypothetical protein